MDYYDYISSYYSITWIVLLIGNIVLGLNGIRKLIKYKRYLTILLYSLFILLYPFLLKYFLKSADSSNFLLVVFPIMLIGIAWLIIGFVINKHAELIESGEFIPFYLTGDKEIRKKGILLSSTAIILWGLLYDDVFSIGFFEVILSLYSILQFYWGLYLIITGKNIDER